MTRSFWVETLGCPKNQVDSDKLTGTLLADGLVPADVVLACGIFGNVNEADIHSTIRGLPALSRPGATVLWTRHRKTPDLTPQIRGWFADADFDEVGFDYEEGRGFSVGTQLFRGVTPAFDPTVRFFEFEPRG